MRAGAIALGSGLALASVLPLTGAAQERLQLQGGFWPDPQSLSVQSQGAVPAAAWVQGCPGWLAEDHVAVVTLDLPDVPLRFYASGDGLEGLVVAGPDGLYRCARADDRGVVALRTDAALAGDYALWPTGPAWTVLQATVLVSEEDLAPGRLAALGGGDVDRLTAEAEPAFGHYTVPPAGTIEVVFDVSHGVPAAPLTRNDCAGSIDPRRPDVVVTVDPERSVMSLRGRSSVDTTLVAVAPDGMIYCDDDSFGLDPALVIDDAMAGEWAVWVGTYGAESGAAVRLEIGGAPLDGVTARSGGSLVINAFPAFGVHTVLDGDTFALEIDLAGEMPVATWRPECAGAIDPSRPDTILVLPDGVDELALRVRSDEDTTLVIVGPDLETWCDDDTYGLDPAVVIAPAAAGDYAVWVGVYGGGGGTATLELGDLGTVGAIESFDHPFAGRNVASAVAAFHILMEDDEFAEVLTYGRLEETGREGFVLHDVLLTDPDGIDPSIAIDRIEVDAVDLDGLATNGIPERFSLAFAGIDYAALVALADDFDGAVLPSPDVPRRLDLRVSLLPPPGQDDRRDLDLGLDLEGWLGLGLQARMVWPGSEVFFGDVEDLPMEALAIEVRNLGFLGAAVREQALAMGVDPADLGAMALAALEEALAGPAPSAAQLRILEVTAELLADLDRPGVVRFGLVADGALLVDDVLAAIEEDSDGRVRFELSYEPLP